MQPQYKDVTSRIVALIDIWEKALDLQWIQVNHVFIEGYNDDDHNTIADTEAYWQYRHAKVSWYLPAAIRLNDKDLELALVHEYGHVLLCPMESKIPARHAELGEFAIEGLAQALYSVSRKPALDSPPVK